MARRQVGQYKTLASMSSKSRPGGVMGVARAAHTQHKPDYSEYATATTVEPIGGRLIKHARYFWLLAEGHLTRRLVGAMVRRIATVPVSTGRAWPLVDGNLVKRGVRDGAVSTK